jgi:hypothetical protein
MVLAWSGLTRAAEGQSPSESAAGPGEQDVVDQIQQRARKAGLGPISVTRTSHFLGLGDAPVARYQVPALKSCEALAEAFLAYFRERGFQVALPKQRMTVVTLKDDASYRAYIGEEPPESVGGHYDPETNQLVVFDFGSRQRELAARASRVNSFTLAHETTHLLSFNTGLLSRGADVPTCISEGLATFVELWQPRDRRAFGATNILRLQVLIDARDDEIPWVPLSQLIADDQAFDEPKTTQLAYAESWLLIHLLMTPAWRPKFQAYLAGLPKAGGAKGRVAYAEGPLGSLTALDREVRRHAREILRHARALRRR